MLKVSVDIVVNSPLFVPRIYGIFIIYFVAEENISDVV